VTNLSTILLPLIATAFRTPSHDEEFVRKLGQARATFKNFVNKLVSEYEGVSRFEDSMLSEIGVGDDGQPNVVAKECRYSSNKIF